MTPPPALGVVRSLSGRRWVWREAEERLGLGIAERLGVPELLGRVLAARGVTIEAAGDYLAPTLRAMLPDPSLLADMDTAAGRLATAVVAGEMVGVFGDYDVDGACSAALMVGLLGDLGIEVTCHVPDRLKEGFGPNAAALSRLVERGAKLIICTDCGSSAGEALAAIEGRAQVIVLDHHKIERRPPVLALVNPNRTDDCAGLGGLCATAVAFLTAVALLRALRKLGFFAARVAPDLMSALDLVALATVCDVMPLTGLNRALVAQGLKVMARRARPGLASLMTVAEVIGEPTTTSLGFALGPRINAAGRVAEADLGLRLLLAPDLACAEPLARALDAVNRIRQEVERTVLEAAMAGAAAQAEAGTPVLLVSGAGWHPGVVGIVAGRIKERFNRPACVLGLAGDLARGSGRSVPGLDLGAAVMAAHRDGVLESGGGHAMAAGFSLPASRLGAFHAFLNERLAAAAGLPAAADLAVEGALSVRAVTAELAAHLARVAPFGAGNEEPVLVLPRVRVLRADRVGREGRTIRAIVADEDGAAGSAGRCKAMAFRAAEGALAMPLLERAGRLLHLAGHLRLDRWSGSEAASFVITDAALA
ncbi:MAG: single-stranded-DNA-specific exonuclease RecJ [Acetobacteraceae bacterium]